MAEAGPRSFKVENGSLLSFRNMFGFVFPIQPVLLWQASLLSSGKNPISSKPGEVFSTGPSKPSSLFQLRAGWSLFEGPCVNKSKHFIQQLFFSLLFKDENHKDWTLLKQNHFTPHSYLTTTGINFHTPNLVTHYVRSLSSPGYLKTIFKWNIDKCFVSLNQVYNSVNWQQNP